MTLQAFTNNLIANGYSKADHPCLHSHYFTSGNRAVVVDSVRGAAYRLFLGLNCIPASYPATAEIAKQQIDAESPWFHYSGPEQKSEALDRCWQWLQTIGFSFLADPFSKELHRWLAEEKIKIRDRGVIIPLPHNMKLP